MKYLQSSFSIDPPAVVTACQPCVYGKHGGEAHSQDCVRCRPLCWMCREGSARPHVHYLILDGSTAIPADPELA